MWEVRIESLEHESVTAICPSAAVTHHTLIVIFVVSVIAFIYARLDVRISALCDATTEEALICIIQISVITLFQVVVYNAVSAFIYDAAVKTVIVIGEIGVITLFVCLVYKSVTACGESAPAGA